MRRQPYLQQGFTREGGLMDFQALLRVPLGLSYWGISMYLKKDFYRCVFAYCHPFPFSPADFLHYINFYLFFLSSAALLQPISMYSFFFPADLMQLTSISNLCFFLCITRSQSSDKLSENLQEVLFFFPLTWPCPAKQKSPGGK